MALGRRRQVVRGGAGGRRGSPGCRLHGGGQTPNTKEMTHRKCGGQGPDTGKTLASPHPHSVSIQVRLRAVSTVDPAQMLGLCFL